MVWPNFGCQHPMKCRQQKSPHQNFSVWSLWVFGSCPWPVKVFCVHRQGSVTAVTLAKLGIGWNVSVCRKCQEEYHQTLWYCEFLEVMLLEISWWILTIHYSSLSSTVLFPCRDLSGNSLNSIYEGSFGNLNALMEIDLSRNQLKYISPSAFRNLTSLKVIYLHENFIKGGFHLPESVVIINLQRNAVVLNDLRIILRGLRRLHSLNVAQNGKLGPILTSDIFAGLEMMDYLSMQGCGLEHIESGSFRAMQKLRHLDLSKNRLSRLQPGALEGPSDKLRNLFISRNNMSTIADGTFKKFTKLNRWYVKQLEVILFSVI